MLEVKGVRVVVAEDDPAVRDLIITILDLEGYKTWVARDGLEALEVVDAAKPAFVVLDINMPRLDGFDFLAALKKRPMSKKPRVLVLTARNAAEDVKRCVALGAKDYLAKPFTKEQLLGTHGSACARHNANHRSDGRCVWLWRNKSPNGESTKTPALVELEARSGDRPLEREIRHSTIKTHNRYPKISIERRKAPNVRLDRALSAGPS